MTGIIWIVQVAIYPLLDKLQGAVFQDYHTRYMNRVSFVIAPQVLFGLGNLVVAARKLTYIDRLEGDGDREMSAKTSESSLKMTNAGPL